MRADVINMILDLKKRYHTSILFISHDISVVRYVADRIAVMYLGKIVEEGNAEEVVEHPMHPYTKALISNCMSIDLDRPVKESKLRAKSFTGESGTGLLFLQTVFYAGGNL